MGSQTFWSRGPFALLEISANPEEFLFMSALSINSYHIYKLKSKSLKNEYEFIFKITMLSPLDVNINNIFL